ncbi:MAG TPA: hypothetical protein ENK77_03285, partial [Epsilonproteobacteria bacterium]|nr:hypothetical protein [Campylobacterota bacterium]
MAEVLELVFDDQERGATLLAALREHQALHRESARFFVTLARRVGEEEYAYKVAESYYSVDASVAVLYLDMLWTSGEEERFIDAS